MKIAIIAAMHEECEFLRQELKGVTTAQYLNMRIDVAEWSGHEVILIESGIGKVNATLAAQYVIELFEVDYVINTGSAGGIKLGADIGDFVIGSHICHHDIDISPIGFKFGELPLLPVYYETAKELNDKLFSLCHALDFTVHQGTIATGDSFVYRQQQIDTINERFEHVIACEMEAAAVAQVCHLFKTPLTVIRNLSDMAGEHAPINFQKYIEQAGRQSCQLVLNYIQITDH